MTLDALLYASLLMLIASAAGVVLLKPRDAVFLLLWFWAGFLARLLLIVANDTFEIFDAKQSDDIVLGVYESVADDGSPIRKFGVQMLLNWPAFTLFEAKAPIHFVTNAFLGASAAFVAHAYLSPLFSQRVARVGAVVMTMAPAAVNYSIVGVRDMLLYLLVMVSALAVLHLQLRARFRAAHAATLVACMALMFIERPYLVPVMALPAVLMIVVWAWRRISDPTRGSARPLLTFSLLLAVPVVAAVVLGGVYGRLTTVLNLQGEDPIEAIGTFAENRFARDIGTEGGDSHILPADVYLNTNSPVRLSVQIVGMIVVPMPWLLTNATRWFALFDSVLLVVCITFAVKGARWPGAPTRLRTASWIFLLTYAVGIVAFGLATINAGNAFRMRMTLLPYILIPASIHLSRVFDRRARARRVTSVSEVS